MAGLVAVAAGAALGGTIQAVVSELVGIVAMVSIGRGVRRWRPEAPAAWWVFAAGGSAFLVGNLVRMVHGLMAGVESPFPSPADGFYLLGYVLLIVGELVLVRRRSADVEGDNLIDALIVATAMGVVVWAYLIVPYANQPTLGLLGSLLSASYSLADLVLVAVAVRLAVGSGRRPPSWYLLAGSCAAVVIADVLTTLQTAGKAGVVAATASSAVCYVLFATSALHPSMAQLTEKPDRREIALTGRRLVMLCAALLLVPGLLVVEVARGGSASVPVMAVGSVVLAVLVLGRLAGLVRSKERKADRERILRDAGAALVAAGSSGDLHEAAADALFELMPAGDGARAAVAAGDAESWTVVAARGARADEAVGTTLLVDDLPEPISSGLRDHRAVELRTRPFDLPGSEAHEDVEVLVVPLRSRGALSGALVATSPASPGLEVVTSVQVLADLVSLALASAALTEEMHRRRHERRFRALVEHSSDLLSVIGADGMVSFASPSSSRLLGVPAEALVGRPPLERVHPEDRDRAAELLELAWAGQPLPEQADQAEARMRHENGSWRWFRMVADDLTEEPTVQGLVIHARDVTDRKAAELQVAASEARFRSLVQNASDVVLVVDDLLRITYASPSVTRMLGHAVDELVGTAGVDLVHPDDAVVAARLLRGPSDEITLATAVELRVRHADGSWRTLELTVSDLRHEEAVRGLVLNARDVTERKALERDLRHQALHDDLTDLANRTLFSDRVEHALNRRRPVGERVAVLFVDLDDFKTVNDGLGHGVGDELLEAVAVRLRNCLREEDTAARLGGDEFAVLLETVSEPDKVLSVAERVLLALGEPFQVSGRALHVGASIGIALDHGEAETADTLLRDADVAMYLAKSRGKGRFEIFEPGMHATVFERLEMKAALSRGVEREEFHLVYQPIVDLGSGQWSGVEALVRWNHPDRGVVAPDLFIPLAEETGLIVPLGRQVLQQGCDQVRRWLRHPQCSGLHLSVNLSVRQLAHPALVGHLVTALERSGVEPHRLTLEITESLLMEDVDANCRRLAELRELGVRLAIDDFGTGYSSIGYLQRLPVHVLKIDRSLVDPLERRPQQVDMVRAVIELAHSQGLETVAEGVETEGQLAVLEGLGCDAAQGYYFSRPVPPEMLEGLLSERAAADSAAKAGVSAEGSPRRS